MSKQKSSHIGIRIDALTNSIVNTITGDSFPTEVLPFSRKDLKFLPANPKWHFDWAKELQSKNREVFKLTISNNPKIVQGWYQLVTIKTTFI